MGDEWVVGAALFEVSALAEPASVLRDLRDWLPIFNASAGVGSAGGALPSMAMGTSTGLGMMSCCNHVRKPELADNKRLTADFTAVSSTVSTVAMNGAGVGLYLVVEIAVGDAIGLLERLN